MRLRRIGELAFASAVVALSGGFLYLAAGHVLAPVAIVPAAVAAPVVSVPTAAARRVVTVPAKAAMPTKRVAVRGASARPHKAAVVVVAASPRAVKVSPARLVARIAPPTRLLEAQRLLPQRVVPERLAPHATMPPKKREKATVAPGVTGRDHRFGVAVVHVVPAVERTPEPPLGYDERPALLRADEPATASPPQNGL